MITEKVLGAYTIVGTLSPTEQADWYRKAVEEWNISTFEVPILAGVPLVPEVVDVLSELSASIVATFVAQWATAGQKNPAYGLSSLDESSRQAAIADACSSLQQCMTLSEGGVRICNVFVHTGGRSGETIPHAIAFHQSLTDLRQLASAILPDTTLAVEVTDNLPPDHPILFPAAKKASLTLDDLIQILSFVNRESVSGQPIALMVNWGRLLVNGDVPLSKVHQILASEVPLSGVILSGAGPSADGFTDSHNSHLDPQSGFTLEDAMSCASVLASSSQPIFLGTKCSTARGDDELPVETVLNAQAELLNKAN
jgi:hypothetical protein